VCVLGVEQWSSAACASARVHQEQQLACVWSRQSSRARQYVIQLLACVSVLVRVIVHDIAMVSAHGAEVVHALARIASSVGGRIDKDDAGGWGRRRLQHRPSTDDK
jgi:hypothetical protein